MSSAGQIQFFAVNNAKGLLFPTGNFAGIAISQFLATYDDKAGEISRVFAGMGRKVGSSSRNGGIGSAIL